MPSTHRQDAAQLDYIARGDVAAPALLFLHGLGADATQFIDQVEYFAPEYHAISISLRGHGRSSKQFPIDCPTLTTLLDDVVATLGRVHAGPAHWVGNSLGGLIALQALQRTPSAVTTTTIFGTTAELHAPGAVTRTLPVVVRLLGRTGLARVLSATASKDPKVARRFAAMSAALTPEVYAAIAHEIADYDMTHVVQECRTPLLVVKTDGDRAINKVLQSTLNAAGQNRCVTIAHLTGAGHLANMEQPELFNDVLECFLIRSQRDEDSTER